MLQPFYSCSSLVLESPSFLDATPSARRLRGGRPTCLCALHSLVLSCEISTRIRLRSLPLSRVLSLLRACFARPASHPGLSLTRDPAGAYRSTPTLALGFKRRIVVSRGASTICMHVTGHDVGVAADTMELVTRRARRGGHAAGAATQRAQGVTHGEGATSWCRGGASTFCMQAGHRSRRGRGCYFCMHLRCNDVGQGRDSAAGRLSESTAFVPLGLNWQLERG